MMTEFTNELAKVMADESIACIKRGDFDDAKEIYFTMLDKIQDQLKPSIQNPYFLSKLIKASNSNDEVRSMEALMLLKYFETRNLLPKDLLP